MQPQPESSIYGNQEQAFKKIDFKCIPTTESRIICSLVPVFDLYVDVRELSYAASKDTTKLTLRLKMFTINKDEFDDGESSLEMDSNYHLKQIANRFFTADVVKKIQV